MPALVRASGRPRTYIATVTAEDAEMRARIARHRQQRGANWTLIEAPLALAAHIATLDAGTVALVDCLTMWLSNQLFAGNAMEEAEATLLDAIAQSRAPLVLVSNEVGAGGVPENALARRFQSLQGQLNQRIAGRAGLVVSITAGLPLVLKGVLPEGVS